MDIIKQILDTIGPRPSASKQERDTGIIIKKELEKHCNEVNEEKFYCYPSSTNAWMYISLILFLGSVLWYFTNPLVSFSLVVLYGINYFVNKILNIHIYKYFFPKNSSYNIIGKIKSIKTKKKTIIFTAHHDSGNVSPLFEKTGMALIKLNIFLTAVSFIIVFINQFVQYIPLYFVLCFNLFLLGYITLNIKSKQYSPGANDNLSGVATLIEISKKIKKQDHTEIIFISFGAEEIGCIGSKSYVRKHYNEIKNSIIINFDSVSLGKFGFMEKERFFVNYDKTTTTNFKKLIRKHKGKLTNKKIGFMGISDAGSFAQKGIKAISITAVDDKGNIPNWHSLNDVKVKKENINILVKSAIDYALRDKL